ncbi:MAG: transcription elongation factor GreA [Chloroflexi bacterium]|nr:transcription elongation factor GreA [Chloroflexota bacterium]
MSKQEYFLTPEGIKKIKIDLEDLRGAKRKDLADRLRNAVAMGDLSENADYIKAKEDQAFLEGKIQELEAVLDNVVVIEKQVSTGKAEIGSTIIVREGNGKPQTFRIVGIQEANVREGKISYESPIGRSLLGRSAGDTVKVKTPGGEIELDILEIK